MKVPTEVSELVQNSGNNFHAKVARRLSDNGWHVVVSPYYMDQTQNKAREIDLVAEKLWPVTDMRGHQIDNVALRLFIECKYIPSHSVFWFPEKDLRSAKALVCSNGHYVSNNRFTDNHHYLIQSPKVAKVFATSSNKATENEPFYKALNQALNAMVSMRGKPVTVPILNEFRSNPSVIVCSSFDQIYKVDFYTESQAELIKDNFQLETRYAYIDRRNNNRDDYFLLDFIEFDQLEKYLCAIDKDAEIAVRFASTY